MSALPDSMRWIFWDVDFDSLDLEIHADAILARVLEHGRLQDVRAIADLYGTERIHDFFRRGALSVVTERTRSFWRAFFDARDEPWPNPPDFRNSSSAPWID
jgi:hypothetical protein